MCEIGAFIDGMKQKIAEVDYDFTCNGNYSFPVPDLIVDGQPPRPDTWGLEQVVYEIGILFLCRTLEPVVVFCGMM